MPRDDGVVAKRDRLRILLEILPASGDQNFFRSCLLAEALRDERLRRCGLPDVAHRDGDWVWYDEHLSDFFGIPPPAARYLFGPAPKPVKELMIKLALRFAEVG